MSIQHNAHQAAAKLQAVPELIRAQVSDEMATLAARITASMRRRAPKFRSTLTNSIRADQPGPFEWVIAPHTDYADNVEHGRKPGKGLPRFFDPASASIVAWLESRITGAARTANANYRPGAVGSTRRTAAELELRDRYMALSRHVKAHGLKAAPYVKPTADEYRQIVPRSLALAVQRGLRLAGLGQGQGAAA